MALDRVVSLILRAAELVFAAIVAGVNGEYLHNARGASSWQLGRFIYTEVVAALAMLFSLLLLIPFSSTFIHWPLDIFISINWWIAFGLLVDVSHSLIFIYISLGSWTCTNGIHSSSEPLADVSLIGTTSTPSTEISVGRPRLSSPSHSYRLFSGLFLPS
jgi:hypothetical protein